MKSKNRIVYNIGMCLLLLLTIVTLFLDDSISKWLDGFVWAVFTIDVITRLVKSKNKVVFIKHHIFDFLAIVPFYAGFRFFKTIPIAIFLIRTTSMGKRYLLPTYDYLSETKVGRIIVAFILIFIIMPIPLVWIEPQMKTYPDVLWWAIQTTTTVGYGDIVPVTFIGRAMASVLMFLGIGLIGTITGMLTRFMLSEKKYSASDILKKAENFSIHELKEFEEFIINEKNKLGSTLTANKDQEESEK